MSEEERRTATPSAEADPREEQTQPIFGEAERAAGDGDPSDFDTTVVMPAQAAPVLEESIDEQATVVRPAIDETPPDPDPDPDPDPEPEPSGGEDATDRIGDEVRPVEDHAATAETIVAVAAAASAETVVGELSTKSQLAPSSSLHPLLLERIEPSLGRGERLRLDAAHWRVSLGRGEQNDLRLYTASASREHAVIAGNESGEWVLTPAEGKAVTIDGEPTTEPVVLEVGMNLVMGGDHLRCVTEGLERGGMNAPTSAEFGEEEGPGWRSRVAGVGLSWWLIGGVALLGIALIVLAWFGG